MVMVCTSAMFDHEPSSVGGSVTLILITSPGFAGRLRLGRRRSRGATVGVVTRVRG